MGNQQPSPGIGNISNAVDAVQRLNGNGSLLTNETISLF